MMHVVKIGKKGEAKHITSVNDDHLAILTCHICKVDLRIEIVASREKMMRFEVSEFLKAHKDCAESETIH